jgi:hypothetical protein
LTRMKAFARNRPAFISSDTAITGLKYNLVRLGEVYRALMIIERLSVSDVKTHVSDWFQSGVRLVLASRRSTVAA